MLCISGASTFTPEDAFVGYQSDTSASIVFTVEQELKLSDAKLTEDEWEEKVIKYYISIRIHLHVLVLLVP